MWGKTVFALCAFALTVPAGSAMAQSRHALVIGNQNYSNMRPAVNLQTPHADADGYAELLRGWGWKMNGFYRHDVTEDSFREALDELDAARGDDILVVFSGHGWSDDSDYYLVPAIEKNSNRELTGLGAASLRGRSIALSEIIRELDNKGPRRVIIIVDACNDQPISDMVSFEPPRVSFNQYDDFELLILYSSRPGGIAYDTLADVDGGRDQNPYSVFTRHFLKYLSEGGPLLEAFVRTRIAVEQETATVPGLDKARRQIPHIVHDSISGDFSLSRAEPDAAVASPAATTVPDTGNDVGLAVEAWRNDPDLCFRSAEAVAQALSARDGSDWDDPLARGTIETCIYNGALGSLGIEELRYNVDRNQMVTFTQTATASPLVAGEALERLIIRRNDAQKPNLVATRPGLEEFREAIAEYAFRDGYLIWSMISNAGQTRPVELVLGELE